MTSDPRKMFVKASMVILAKLNSDLTSTKHLSAGKDLFGDAEEREALRTQIGEMLDSGPESQESFFELIQAVAQSINEQRPR
ncbi:MAG: hypothetical protein Aurels2KO_55870 [Aureliella sp.]